MTAVALIFAVIAAVLGGAAIATDIRESKLNNISRDENKSEN